MDKSVDSIGTCSLDVDASVTESPSDLCDHSSAGTLRSASITTTPSPAESHLPSYLSLACTVNGYGTTTNYNPERLGRSRDTSPLRYDENLTPRAPTHSVLNNLLSPPNLVPLPLTKMATTDQQYYTTSKFISKQFSSNIFTNETVERVDGGKCKYETKISSVKFESKATNGQTHFENITKEYSSNTNGKSFIQQRVERLYGPGALAQGFFVSRRQKNRNSESDASTLKIPQSPDNKHSKSMTDKLLEDEVDDASVPMKQSNSSPTLPVLRHLRPEFRAQLPAISPRKMTENISAIIPKSNTVPTNIMKDSNGTMNGHGKIVTNGGLEKKIEEITLDKEPIIVQTEKETIKDGHYFLNVLEEESKKLLVLADKVEEDLNTVPDLTEEVIGKLRSFTGKARLLVAQKIQQFKGLCTNNLTRTEGEAFPTTNEDLQGFWDMVMLQVDQVYNLFKEIDELKKNNWQEVKVEPVAKSTQNGNLRMKKVTSRPKLSQASEEVRKIREAERKKMLEERRKAMKAKISSSPKSIEIFVPETS